jgi:hypothetical protein
MPSYKEITENPAMDQAVAHLVQLLRSAPTRLENVDIEECVKSTASTFTLDRYNLRYAFYCLYDSSPEGFYQNPKKLNEKPIEQEAIRSLLIAKCLNNIDVLISKAHYASDIRSLITQACERAGFSEFDIRAAWRLHYKETPESYFESLRMNQKGDTYSEEDDWADYYGYGAAWAPVGPSKQSLAWKRLLKLIAYVKEFDPNQKIILKPENFKIES